jgi:hypothetical protein
MKRRNLPDPAVGAALGLVLSSDPRATDRRSLARRRGDAASVSELVSDRSCEVKAFTVAGSRERKSALYECGCIVVDPVASTGSLQLLECPTHAALQAQLRRRQSDRL